MSAANSSNFAKGDVIWVINPLGVRLRDKPDARASSVETARFGTRLQVIEAPRTWRGTEQWLRIMTDDGREAWIDRGSADTPFVSRDKPDDAFDVIVHDEPHGSLPAEGLIVRSDQTLTAPVIGRVKAGERLAVFVLDKPTEGGTWYGVRTPLDQFGWVLDQTGRWLQRARSDADYADPVMAGSGTTSVSETPPAKYDETPGFEQGAPTSTTYDESPSFAGGSFELTDDSLVQSKELSGPKKPIGPEKPIENQTAATPGVEEKSELPKSSSTERIIVFVPPSEFYARPPDENKVTISIAEESVKLICGNHEYASVNRLDYDQLAAARLKSAEMYGRVLFEGLFNDDKLSPLASTRDGYIRHMSGEADVIFELDIAPGETSLHTVKWEYLTPPGDVPPLAVFKKSPFFRHLGGQPPKAPPGWPLKVLVAIVNPSTLGLPLDAEGYPVDKDGQTANKHLVGLKPIDVAQERTILTDALEQVKQFGAVEYTILDGSNGPVTLAAIRQALGDGDFHVLHVVAHGVLVDNEQFHLVLAAGDGREDLVPVDKFDSMRFGKLRLVVLDTCQSATLSLKGALHGLAPRLIEIGVPAVVAMQDLVPVPTAQRFTQWFYHHLARSGRIDMAMAATRLQLYDLDRRSRNWGIPVLFMSSDDGRLFAVSDDEVQRHNMPEQPALRDRYFPPTDADDLALSNYLASQAAQLGASPGLLNAYRGWAAQPPSQPLLDPQKRGALTKTIKNRVTIKASELQAYVTQNGGDRRLQLDAEVFARIASALNAGKHIILIGPPGTGKTTLAQRICEYAQTQECAGGVAVTTATADWTTFDTVGGYVPTQQQTLEFRPGAFLRAIRDGQWLIIDEINRAEIDKAFGELFTLLSGQGVDLPYTVRGQPVRVRPPKSAAPQDWIPDDLKHRLDDYDFVVHPTWRIIGTMNVYDKSYLFAMSFAFMRRFAFIDCDLPGEVDDTDQAGQLIKRDLFAELIDVWLQAEGLGSVTLQTSFKNLIKRNTALMKRRALGPAIIRDMLFFIKDRHGDDQVQANGVSDLSLLGEAILLYAVPQLDGLDRQDILDIYKYLSGFLTSDNADKALDKVRASVLDRIELLYPHIRPDEWQKALT